MRTLLSIHDTFCHCERSEAICLLNTMALVVIRVFIMLSYFIA